VIVGCQDRPFPGAIVWQSCGVEESKLYTGEGSMNVDRLKGKWMQLKGELKQRWGKLTRNDIRQHEGSYEKSLGLLQERYGSDSIRLIQERYGGNKEELIRWAERWQWKSAPDAVGKQSH
jgi:uncharacterized protein YjbJ (UPF0337 family)